MPVVANIGRLTKGNLTLGISRLIGCDKQNLKCDADSILHLRYKDLGRVIGDVKTETISPKVK